MNTTSDQLLEDIKRAANNIREAKQRGASRNELLEDIFQLLYYKYYYCLKSPEEVTNPELFVPTTPKKILKIRWKTQDPDNSKKVQQLQAQWREGDILLSTDDIVKAVCLRNKKVFKHPTGNILKIELIKTLYDKADEQRELEENVETFIAEKNRKVKRSFVTLSKDHPLKMTLRTPGPQLCDVGVFNLRVTYKNPIQQNTSFSLVDCGVNLFNKQFASNLAPTIDDAIEQGVTQMILISTNENDATFNIELSKRRPGTLFVAIGIHPTIVSTKFGSTAPGDVDAVIQKEISRLEQLINTYRTHSNVYFHHPLIVAIGECGIDLQPEYASHCDMQERFFEAQVQLANRVGLPVLIHEREAHKNVVNILRKHKEGLKAVINCFNGDQQQAQAYLDVGASLSISGLLSNAGRNEKLLASVPTIPLNRLLLGSDAPYLTPFNMPKPYPKNNEPFTLSYVALKVAELTGKSADEIAKHTTENARTLFTLPTPCHDDTTADAYNVNPNVRVAYNSDVTTKLYDEITECVKTKEDKK